MNITLDLSKSQLSKLRNGHGIRIGPAMFGKGVDMIIDPMTYYNMKNALMRSTFEYIEYINRIRIPVRAGGHAFWASAFAQNPPKTNKILENSQKASISPRRG